MVTGAMLATFVSSAVSIERAGAIPVVPTCQGEDATIWSDGNGVTRKGTGGRDVIVGTVGNDKIKGNGGDDIICGGWGDDKINGGTGNDFIIASEGDDVASGDAGNDEIWGDFGPQHLGPGSVGSSEVSGQGGRCFSDDDTLKGGTGDDLLVDFLWENDLDGGANDDFVFGNGLLKGNSGRDGVSSNYDLFVSYYYDTGPSSVEVCADDYTPCPTSATLEGGSGNDDLIGSEADDLLNGGSGNDRLDGAGGFDHLNGGSGRDECDDQTDTVFKSREEIDD